jgi:hypothetical protein
MLKTNYRTMWHVSYGGRERTILACHKGEAWAYAYRHLPGASADPMGITAKPYDGRVSALTKRWGK